MANREEGIDHCEDTSKAQAIKQSHMEEMPHNPVAKRRLPLWLGLTLVFPPVVHHHQKLKLFGSGTPTHLTRRSIITFFFFLETTWFSFIFHSDIMLETSLII